MAFDTRRIQTAVLGDAESDEPLVCPTEPGDLDAFRREYQGSSFWCGVLLGGCGGELITRRYGDRVCHFSHVPDPENRLPVCQRRGRSADAGSADHLYVKVETRAWLRRQGHRPDYRFTEGRAGFPGGSAVDVTAAGVDLRFHMDPSIPLVWDGASELVLGPGVAVDRVTLQRRGYVNRFKFESDGSRRGLRFGTEVPQHGTEWFAPEECTVTPDGRLLTPVVERLLIAGDSGPDQQPVLTPPTPSERACVDHAVARPADVPESVSRLVRRLKIAVRDRRFAEVRELLRQADLEAQQCAEASKSKLLASSEDAQSWLEEQEHLRRLVFDDLRKAVDARQALHVASLMKQAKRLVAEGDPATGSEAAVLESARRMLPPGRTAAVPARKMRIRGAVSQPSPTLQAAPPAGAQVPGPAAPRFSDPRLEAAAAAVRGALRKAARERATSSWSLLRQKLGSALPRMSDLDRVNVLILVDRSTSTTEPLLTTLLAAGDPEAWPDLRTVSEALGRTVPADDNDLRAQVQADTELLHRLFRYQ